MKKLALAAFAVVATLCLASLPARADEKSEQAAADLLHKKLQSESPQDAALLGAVKGKDIVVVAGSMDHIETVLAAARIKFTLIQPEQVARWQLRNDQIVMVNCPGRIPDDGVQRIQKFVRAGGLLYTTDWSLANLVQKAFPGTIAHNGSSTGNEVVPVIVDKASDNLMSKMLLTGKGEPQWWLEGSSYPIKILDSKKVEVLAHSKLMGQRYGSAPVVVRFRWEDGEVIHVVSHFVRQMATQGQQVAAAAKVDSISGLSDGDKKAFKETAASQANFSDVESSYAFQKMTTNLVVDKQRKNADLDRAYNMTVAAPTPIAGQAVAPGAKLKVLGREGKGRVRVRDDQGNEGYVAEDSLVAR
ncbi:MAG: SH3 domain-containing protein [Myxococcales bacterium]